MLWTRLLAPPALRATQIVGQGCCSFHSSRAVLDKRRNEKRTRRGGRSRPRNGENKESNHDHAADDTFEDHDFEVMLVENTTNIVRLPSTISMDSDWKLPAEITSALKQDPTFFHGREGLASSWTPPSSRLSEAMLNVFAEIRREQELKTIHDDEEGE